MFQAQYASGAGFDSRLCSFDGSGLVMRDNFDGTGLILVFVRSEERRVGKECRSRWSPYH